MTMKWKVMLQTGVMLAFSLTLWATTAHADDAGGQNLLANPSFEPPWTKRYDPCKNTVLEEVQVPEGWTPYYVCQSTGDPPNINRTPEYRLVAARDYGYRVRSGATALRYFNFWALNRSAGVYQAVNVTPGSQLRFSLWVQLWTTNVDAQPPTSKDQPGNLEARLCIVQDKGQLDFYDPNTVCSAWARPWDQYQQLSVEGTAMAGQVTVALNTRAEFPVKHNDVMADDAELVVIGQAVPVKPPAPAVRRTNATSTTYVAPAPKPVYVSPRNDFVAE